MAKKDFTTVKIEVELTFSNDVVFGWELKDIANNIAKALVRQYREDTISSDNSDASTKGIKVSEPRSKTVIECEL